MAEANRDVVPEANRDVAPEVPRILVVVVAVQTAVALAWVDSV